MMISTHGRYALRVLVDLAENQRDGYVTLKEVAKRQDISEKYLESIAKKLVQAKLLIGIRGKGGGYRLACSPERINVLDVLELMEGTLAPVACLEKEAAPCGFLFPGLARPKAVGAAFFGIVTLGRDGIEHREAHVLPAFIHACKEEVWT